MGQYLKLDHHCFLLQPFQFTIHTRSSMLHDLYFETSSLKKQDSIFNITWAMLGKAAPLQAHYRPLGIQKVDAPRFRDSVHMKMAMLSAVSIGRLYPPPPSRYFDYSFLLKGQSTPGPEWGRKDYANEYLNDTFRSRTRDPPASVPLPTAPLSALGKQERPSCLCRCCTICSRGIGLIINQVSLFFRSLKFAQIIYDSSVPTSQ